MPFNYICQLLNILFICFLHLVSHKGEEKENVILPVQKDDES